MAETQPPNGSSDSINDQDPHTNPDEKKAKSRRPANTAFRQQRLKAWQPILTPKTVLPLFFAIGIIFAPIGGGLLYASAQVQEIIIDYSTCFEKAPIFPATAPMNPDLITKHFLSSSGPSEETFWSRTTVNYKWDSEVEIPTTQCQIKFSIPHEMKPPVLFYYRLTNFYQNHRRYAKSFNTDQLSGTAVSANTIHSSDCTPLTTETIDGIRKPYYPCGLAANSFFNDTFESPVLLTVPAVKGQPTVDNQTYVMKNNSNIAWASDTALYGKTKYNASDILVPPNWVKRYPNGYTEANLPQLRQMQSFQVWMRLAGLPTFSKLYQRNDDDIMRAGTYSIAINHNFNVTDYGGTKAIIISTRTVMGGKNPFLGIAYVVVGGICILLGALFTVTHLIKPRKLGDHTYLSWNNDQPSTATASGREGAGTDNHA